MKTLLASLTLLALGFPALGINHITSTTDIPPTHYAILTSTPALALTSPTTTVDSFIYPSPLAKRRGVCERGMTFCNDVGNCCPPDTYCTVDILQSGACCAYGASCTGLSNPVTGLATGNWATSGVGSAGRPMRFFVMLARLMKLGSTCSANKRPPVSGAAAGERCLEEENEEHVSTTQAMSSATSDAPVEGKKGGGGGGGGHGGVGTEGGGVRGGEGGIGSGGAAIQGAGNRGAAADTGKASTVSRPVKLFSVPFVLGRHVKAAILPVVNTTSEALGKLKLMGANEAMIMAQNRTSSATSMPRPSRLFSLALALTQQIRAAALPTKNGTAHSTGNVKFMGGNVYYLENANHTSNAAGRPRLPRIFSIVFALASHVKATVLAHRSGGPDLTQNATASFDLAEMSSAQMLGGDEHKFRFRGGGGSGGSGVSRIQPLQIFRVLVLLARDVKAAFLSRSPSCAADAPATPSSYGEGHHPASVAVSHSPTSGGHVVPTSSAD